MVVFKIGKSLSLLLLLLFSLTTPTFAKTNKDKKNDLLDNIADYKEFKKLLRTKTNVLVLFVSNSKQTLNEKAIFAQAATSLKGTGTLAFIDCEANNDKKKLCKKLKINPAPFEIKHYKDGDFHLNYARQLSHQSIVNFMRDPTGDLPWEEDEAASDVLHFTEFATLQKHLKKDVRPMMLMFYVTWCGHCKRMKPDYAKAATELKLKGDKHVLAAMDVEKTENMAAKRAYNISGFPTLIYFEKGRPKQLYEGDNTKEAIMDFMLNPKAAVQKKPVATEPDWSADTNSDIVHLTTQGFEPALKDEKSVLVMFYAPWCGHCKRMKPEYETAAKKMRERGIPGILAALDATKESSIAQKFKVNGYPTLKYFINGVFKFDVNFREADKIIEFMKDPKEPPPPPPPEKPWEEEEDSEVLFLDDNNFSSTLKRKKHALVMFYAPWCGHCKKAKPEFKAAAEHFANDPRVVFVAVDCSTKLQEFCKQHDVRGYPTFKYFSYFKSKLDYNGGRNRQDFIDYMSNPPQIKAHEEL